MDVTNSDHQQRSPPTLSDIQEQPESSVKSSDFDSISTAESRPTNPTSLRSKQKTQETNQGQSSASSGQSEKGVPEPDQSEDVSQEPDQSKSEHLTDASDLPPVADADPATVDASSNQEQERGHVIADVGESRGAEDVAGTAYDDKSAFVGPHMCAAAWAELNNERAESTTSSVETYTDLVRHLAWLNQVIAP